MADRDISSATPKSVLALDEGEELDESLVAGFPIYRDGVEIDRFYPLQQPPIDEANLPESTRQALALAGAWSDLDWEQTEADLERIDRESKPTPPIELDW
jgi:hypothetical protein